MGVSKVEYGGNTLIDLTEDSVTPETLAEGETAHNKAGEEITGTLKVQDEIVTTTGTGSFYKANVKGITELKSGVSFVMIPHTVSTSSTPMLAVNNLAAKIIKRMGVNSTLDDMSISDIPSSDWIKPSRAYRVMYNNGFWFLVDFPRPSAKDLIDNVPVEKGGVPSTNADNAGKILTTNASGTPEWQEPSGGEIDTSNLATVDKVSTIDMWYGDKRGISENGVDGIQWRETFALLDDNDGELKVGTSMHRIPIVAGENITFEVDEENQVVKINATGGGSSTPSVSLIGTWTVIDNPEIPTSDISLEFTSNGTEYIGIGSTSMGSSSWGINALSYKSPEGYYEAAYVNNPSGSYGIDHGWKNEAYRYITVTKEPDDPEAIAWLGNNTDAPKVKLEKEQMPQIRFANFQDTAGSMLLREDNPFTFTVEVLGGGELKEGDLLQICVRRKYWYKTLTGGFKHKWKLRSVVQREITDEDFGKRFLSINVTLGDVESRGNWLFRNDRNPLNSDGTIDTHSYMYFRIKRVTQYGSDGEECNAIFSNVEKVAKTYAPHTKHLTIK